MCADLEVMRHFPYVLTREVREAHVGRFVRHWEERGFGLWAMEEKASGAFIGFVGLQYNEEWSEGEHKTKVGWRLARAWWNRGPRHGGRPGEPRLRV
jgi:RimJ/RimL family protein N-acetyltransferase